MGAFKSPGRVIDGPNAQWQIEGENAQVVLTNNSSLQLGQPLCIDVTQLGPDANVPNNGAALPQCERLVATTSANAGPIWGVLSAIPGAASSAGLIQGLTLTYQNGFNANATIATGGIPTWTNKTGSTITVTVQVCQTGFAYVLAGAAAIGQTGGNSILVGSTLITTTAQPFAIQGSAVISGTVGTTIANAINTYQANPGGALAAGVVSVIPSSLVGWAPPQLINVDVPGSTVQEAVSIGSISYPTASIAVVNSHTAGVKFTGPNAGTQAKNAVLISTPGAGVTVRGLVATWVNIGA